MKATPVAEVSPMLPNTMAWTLTAVPQLAGMAFSSRYLMARGFIQEPNTAPIAPQSCSSASCGKSVPCSSLHDLLVARDQVLPVLGAELGVEAEALALLVVLERLLEGVVLHAEHHVRVHRDEAAVAVVGEARVARGLGQRLDGRRR